MADLLPPIEVKGIREIQAALKDLDGESQKRLRVVFNDAADIVVRTAAPKVPSGPSGRARKSLRAKSEQRRAKVMGGSARVPYYPWLDFGGKVGRERSVSRHFHKGGRYIYPSYNAKRGAIFDSLSDALADLSREAGLT